MTTHQDASPESSGVCKRIARGIGLAALAGTLVPPALFMTGGLGHLPMQWLMLVAAIAWFMAAPFWMDVE
jgi:hypothetical protein